MGRAFWVLGTGTDVGKTFVSGFLVAGLRRRGREAGYYKPVASGGVRTPGGLAAADALWAAEASGLGDDPVSLGGCVYETPVSPHLAARLEGRPVDRGRMDEELARWRTIRDPLVVEGAGGLAVPLDDRGTLMADLAVASGLPAVLVAAPGLGSLNHTALSAAFARGRGIPLLGVVVCGHRPQDPVERDNLLWMERMAGAPLLGVLPRADLPERPRDWTAAQRESFVSLWDEGTWGRFEAALGEGRTG